MNKFYITLFLVAFGFALNAQNITNSTYPDTIVGKYTEGIIEEKLIITNSGTNSMSMHVYRNTIDMPGNSVNYYCWGPNCFPPTTSLSTDPVFLESGKSDSSFISYLEPYQEEGITIIDYSFFDELGSGDSLNLRFVFKTVPPPASTNELINPTKLYSIVPNPAKDLAFLRYSLPNQENQKLVIYDLVGKKIQEIDLLSGEHNVLLNVSDFEGGIYLCNLISSGKVVDTQKLVVGH